MTDLEILMLHGHSRPEAVEIIAVAAAGCFSWARWIEFARASVEASK